MIGTCHHHPTERFFYCIFVDTLDALGWWGGSMKVLHMFSNLELSLRKMLTQWEFKFLSMVQPLFLNCIFNFQ
jgi:hypothetical protein